MKNIILRELCAPFNPAASILFKFILYIMPYAGGGHFVPTKCLKTRHDTTFTNNLYGSPKDD